MRRLLSLSLLVATALASSYSHIPLPPNWEERRYTDGRLYYLNHEKKTTQWEDPRLMSVSVPASVDGQQAYMPEIVTPAPAVPERVVPLTSTCFLLNPTQADSFLKTASGEKEIVTIPSKENGYTLEVLHEDPKLVLVNDFVTDAEREHMLAVAEPLFNRSNVIGDKGGAGGNNTEVHEARTSYTAHIPNDDITKRIQTRAAALAMVPVSYVEPLQVVRYEQGQYYRAHHDWFKNPDQSGMINNRMYTFLVYLTDFPGENGGATEFPSLGIKVQPKKNAAAFWRNLHVQGETGDVRTLHGGNPPVSGVKYAINIWIRNAPFTH